MSNNNEVGLPPDLFVGATGVKDSSPWTLPSTVMNPVWDKISGYGVSIAIIDTGYEDNDVLPKPTVYKNMTNESDRLVNDHGIHCASSALGRRGIGAAPDATLMAYKVLAGRGGSGGSDWIAKAIREAADDGADVISLSLGGSSPYRPTQDALAYAFSKGAVVVAAAGNSGFNGRTNTIGYPAKFDTNVICCGATKGPYESQKIAGFSSGGRQLDFAVGGQNILGARSGNKLGMMSGTSMACPLLAGFYALAIEALRLAGKPCPKDYNGWKSLFTAIAKDAGHPGFDQSFGHGIVYADDIADLLHDAMLEWGL
jgi:subtilisin family serine protease